MLCFLFPSKDVFHKVYELFEGVQREGWVDKGVHLDDIHWDSPCNSNTLGYGMNIKIDDYQTLKQVYEIVENHNLKEWIV